MGAGRGGCIVRRGGELMWAADRLVHVDDGDKHTDEEGRALYLFIQGNMWSYPIIK